MSEKPVGIIDSASKDFGWYRPFLMEIPNSKHLQVLPVAIFGKIGRSHDHSGVELPEEDGELGVQDSGIRAEWD